MDRIVRVVVAAAVTCNLAVHAGSGFAQSTAFFVPLQDGTTWHFIETESWTDTFSGPGSSGPSPADFVFSATDRQVFDYQAAFITDNDWFLGETPDGYFTIADGDPALGQRYEYYTDPRPFMLSTPLALGQELAFDGAWQGQWSDGAGGYQTWTGTWTATFKNLGPESVTTPLGTFDAVKLGVEETSLRTGDGAGNTSRQTWSEVRWFVEGLGFVKVEGSGLSENDFGGDGVTDHFRFEENTLIAVPEPGTWLLLGGGLLVLVVRSAFRRRRNG